MTKLNKVVIIGPAYPLRGGIASFNERLARALQDVGIEVYIYTFSLQYPSILFPGKTQYSEDAAPDDLNISVSINSINPFNWIKIGLELKALNPDAIICRFWIPFMGPSLGTIMRISGRNKWTKKIGFVDNIIPHEKRPGDKVLTNYFSKTCDSFLVMSRIVERDLQQFIKDQPVLFTHHPLFDNYGEAVSRAVALKKLDLDPSFRYLLFFGFIRDYKGLDLLLKAMSNADIKTKKIKLIVAGEYYVNEANYEEMIDSLEIRNQLILHTNYISNEAISYYFNAADLIVQPYKTATQSGVSGLAYFYEKPMLVTNVGGLGEVLKHGTSGYVVEVDDKPIAQCINDFFDNSRMESFIKYVKEDKKIFSWDKIVMDIKQLYQTTRQN